MAFEYLTSLVFENDFERNENESDIDVEPENLEPDFESNSDSDSDSQAADVGQAATGDQDITWSDILSDVTPRMQPFTEISGPVHSLEGDEPFDLFQLFLGDEQLKRMVLETNRYAQQQQQEKGEDRYWKPVDYSDICAYIAINIFFGLKKLPQTALYWSSDPFWREPAITDMMGRQRFTKIHQYFHLAESSQQPTRDLRTFDPLYKVRPLPDHVRGQCYALYKPKRKLSVDEGMVGYTGRLSFKQYIKKKPTPLGIKIWCLAESDTGYLLNSRVYTGKNEAASPHVVFSMVQPYLDLHHIVYFEIFLALHVWLLTSSCGAHTVVGQSDPTG